MAELSILKVLLFIAYLLAPVMEGKFFLRNSKLYAGAHKTSIVLVMSGAALGFSYTAIIWPFFCLLGFFLYLKIEKQNLFTPCGLAGMIPFTFSLISSLWFFCGTFDLHLLGYNQAWSFYAALHGAFLGWLFVGCLAYLGRKPRGGVYLFGCYLALPLFLFVAFGINGVPYIKRIGVIGFALLTPIMMGRFAWQLDKSKVAPITLATLGLLAILTSMLLAVLNEFWIAFPRVAFGFPTMVLSHGVLNAAVAVPCFFIAVFLDQKDAPNPSEWRGIENPSESL